MQQRYYAESARLISNGESATEVRTFGFLLEVQQWMTEWGDDYRSGFSPEDLSSNAAGIDFAENLEKGESLATGFLRWAAASGAVVDPEDPSTGYDGMPAQDPSFKGGTGRGGSNATSSTPLREAPIVRVNGIDSARMRKDDEQ